MRFSPALAKALRERMFDNPNAAADAVGLTRHGLVNIEEGDSSPNVKTLERMATAYGVAVWDFFEHDREPATRPNGRKQNDQAPVAVSGKSSATGAR